MSLLEEFNGKLGFGAMRLPMNGEKVDTKELCKMIDVYMENGFNYFDTAHAYVDEKSEPALRECLVERYPREKYFLVNKLSEEYIHKEEDVRPFFDMQLKTCGVDYFDLYLMHAQNLEFYTRFKKCKCYDIAREFLKDGKIKHFGISFHDKPEVLDMILTENPDIEIVQIQFNYLDYEDPAVQARNCYDICKKHGKPIIVMEPVKGGTLVKLSDESKKVLMDSTEDKNLSIASFAIRYAASFEENVMILSGMSNMEQMLDNISYMKDFKKLTDKEMEAVKKVAGMIHAQNLIQCTACRYCIAGCPQKIDIPDIFSCYNAHKREGGWNARYYYESVYAVNNSAASDCIKCGKCEKACPQHLKIRDLLKDIAMEFGK